MALQQVFISYSREQFYFAESLVLSLQSYGVTIWFDVQRIYPGSDWEHDIADGLTTSTDLVLIASRAALASPHVRKEWEHAIKTNVSIYVVLFENVSLPSELKDAAVIDMRSEFGSFESRASLLAKLLLTKQRHYHEKQIARLLFLHPPGPFTVIASMWTSAFLSLVGLSLISTILLIKISSIPEQPLLITFSMLAVVINWLFFIGYTLIHPWQFTRRDSFSMRMYLFSIYVIPIDTAALLTFDLEFFHRVQSQDLVDALRAQYSPIEYNLSTLLIGCGLLISIMVVWLLRTQNAFHWFRTGSAPDMLRFLVNKKWLLPWHLTPIPTTTKTYRLYYHPADRQIADEIVTALEKNPYLQRGTDHQVDYHIAILTSKVTLASFNRLLNTAHHLVCVIGTNIRLPEDKRPYLRLQWIDYRKRQPEQLKSLTNLLHHGSTYVKGYAFSILPENLEHKVLPEDLLLLSILLNFVAALSISISLFLLFFTWNIALRLCIALVALLCGAYLFYNTEKLEIYNISRNSLKVNYILVLVCSVLFDIFGIFVVPGTSSSSFFAFLYSSVSVYFFAGIAINILVHFFFLNQQKLLSKKVINTVILFFMISILSKMCGFLSTPYPDLNTYPWLYNIAPSTVIACFFTAFLCSLPFTSSFSLRRISSLLPVQVSLGAEIATEPTLAVPTHPWLIRAIYLILAFEIALLFLTQLYP